MSPAPPPHRADLRIRDAREADAAAVATLLGELGYPTSVEAARERVARSLEDPASELLLACSGDQVLGLASMCRLHYFPDGTEVLRLTALVVAEKARRLGIASALVERASETARRLGCSGVEVTTAERRSDAHAFYHQKGFRRTAYRFFRAVGPS